MNPDIKQCSVEPEIPNKYIVTIALSDKQFERLAHAANQEYLEVEAFVKQVACKAAWKVWVG